MEELYRSLYSKYGGDLSEAEVNEKVNYAMTLDTNDFINSFYNKYTGSGPNMEQQQYINSYSIADSVRKGRVEDINRDNLLDSYSAGIAPIKAILPFIANFAGGSAKIISGIAAGGEAILENFQGMTREEQIEDGINPLSEILDKFSDNADKFDRVYRDENGNALTFQNLIQRKEYARAANLAGINAAESAPSTLVAALAPAKTGLALLGLSAAGGKYKEDLVNRPDVTANELIKNSILNGVSEGVTEVAGGKFIKSLYLLNKTGATGQAVKEFTRGFLGSFTSKFIAGASSEAVTESLNAYIQTMGDEVIYGDTVTQKQYVSNWVNSLGPAVILGGFGGGLAAFSKPDKETIYRIMAPQQWRSNHNDIGTKLAEAQENFEAADESMKPKFQKQIDDLLKQKQESLDALNGYFDSLTEQELKEYAEDLDITNQNQKIIGNNKYTRAEQERAEQENLDIFQKLQNQFGQEYTAETIEIQQLVGQALENQERLDPLLKKLKGINKDDLETIVINNKEELEKLPKDVQDKLKRKDGMFLTKKDGKATIYINAEIANLTGATNVVAHELLHYMISRKFKTDNTSMKPLIGELKRYLKENHKDEYDIIQKRIDKFYTDKKTGKIKEGALEEYITVFSDLIAKEKIDLGDLQTTGLRNQLKNVTAGFGFGNFKLDNAQDLIKFISTFNQNVNRKGLLGKAMGLKILDVGLESKKLKEGRSRPVGKAAQSDLQGMLDSQYQGDIKKMGRDAVSVTPEGVRLTEPDLTKSRLGKDLGAVVEDITKRLYDPIVEKGDLTRSEYKNALVGIASEIIRTENFDPNIQTLDKFVSSRLYLRANRLATDLGVPQEFTKDIDNIKEPTTETDTDIDAAPVAEPRKLSDFDVELENGEFDETVMLQIEDLIEANPPDIEDQLNTLVEKELFKAIDRAVGRVRNINGVPTMEPEYEIFIRQEYEEIVKSLGIEAIRTNYKNLFERRKLDRKDYKTVNPTTGETVSNYRKDVFSNIVNKAKFVKYFTTGKPTTIRERRAALLKMITRRKAELAVDNYLAENSDNIDTAIAAKLRSFVKIEQRAVAEALTFDDVKFSATETLQNLAVIEAAKNALNRAQNLYYTNISKKTRKYRTKNGKRVLAFANLGIAVEQAVIDMVGEFDLNGVRVVSVKASEKDGMADMVLEVTVNGEIKTVGIELKLGEKIRMPSQMVAIEFKDGEVVRLDDKNKYDIEGDILIDINADIKQAEPEIKELYEFLGEQHRKFNNGEIALSYDQKTKKFVVDPNGDIIGQGLLENAETLPESVDSQSVVGSWAFDLAKKAKLPSKLRAKTKKEVDLNKMAQVYVQEAKGAGQSDYIEFIGTGAFPIVEDPLGTGVEILAGTIFYEIEASATKSLDATSELGQKYPFKIRKIRPRIVPKNPKITSKSNFSFASKQSLQNLEGVGEKSSISLDIQADQFNNLSKAVENARPIAKYSESIGMSTFDFDETLIVEGENFVTATRAGETVEISSAEWPLKGEKYQNEGWEFDFKDFVNVRGGKEGPLLQKMKNQIKKYGPKNVFVLTARQQQAAPAIHGWLKTQGINIPIENITGLGNSTGEAKAEWMLNKFAEGYNDMYFVDDALPNVKAVADVLEQLDVKSNVQQARIKASESLDADFNTILEEVTGINAKKRFAATKARLRGATKGKFRYFIPPSHEDFVGLLYNFMGKGALGNKHRDFFDKHLVRPLNRAYRELNAAKQAIANDYAMLRKNNKSVVDKLKQKTPDGDFTYEDAVRIYLWNKHGHKIPGLSKADEKRLSDLVKNDPQLKSYADQINTISKQDQYVPPTEEWEVGDIRTDLTDATGRVGRAKFFEEFFENADIIFSEENLNKIEAAYGAGVRNAIQDILYRTKTGRNRPEGQNALVNKLMNYLNGAVGSVMFFNIRSAVLQQMSFVNFINFADNNIFKFAKAFANQKQYWDDFAMLFNSDFMKQRRSGIQTDVNGAELAASVRNSKNPVQALIRKLLQLGFLPTQIGDNIAIAIGGAAMYRNRVNTYLKQGFSQAEAQRKAFVDFQEIAESTQQSARPDMISQQQASPLGKLILAFQNVTSQYNRLGKKAMQDLINRRITPPYDNQFQSDMSNANKLLYYFAIQNITFYSLQTALFAAMFGTDTPEEDERFLKKRERVLNGTVDSVLRGAGIMGAVVSTLKNMAIKFAEQRKKGYRADESAVLMEALNVSPPLGIKARKIVNAEKTLQYNKKVIQNMDLLDLDNPVWSAVTSYTEAITNVPVNRLHNKTQNVRQSLNNQNTAFERLFMFLGWSQYNLGIENKEIEAIKKQVKKAKKSNLPVF